MQKHIAITGATGFIGTRIAHRLVAQGWKVRALVRPASAAQAPKLPGVVWEVGELSDCAAMERLVSGVDGVVHCAGAVRGATSQDFDQVNVDSTVLLAEIASKMKEPPRFLLISSLAARSPELSLYAASKRKGEAVLANHAGTMSWGALRPPAVYGPGDKEMKPLFQWMFRGLAPLIGPESNRVSLLYVDDLAGAVVGWFTHCNKSNQVFELHDGTPGGYSWLDIIDVIEKMRDRTIRKVQIPLPLLRFLAACNLKKAELFGGKPMLSPGKVRELTHHDWVADNAQINRAIDWQPQIRLAEGLTATFGKRTTASGQK